MTMVKIGASCQAPFKERASIPSLPSLRFTLLSFLLRSNLTADKLLDLGCGDGSLTIEVAKMVRANEVYGVDISDEALMVSAQRGITTKKLDLNYDRLPFPDEYFDLVIAAEVIEHMENTDNLLNEAWRVLSSGGSAILSTPNICSYINRILVALGYLPVYYEVSPRWRVGKPLWNKVQFNASGHLRLYNLRALKDHLEVSGFKVVKVYGAPIYQQSKLVKVVDGFFAHIASLASGVIVLAKKQNSQSF